LYLPESHEAKEEQINTQEKTKKNHENKHKQKYLSFFFVFPKKYIFKLLPKVNIFVDMNWKLMTEVVHV
jgi:hypothetical protein